MPLAIYIKEDPRQVKKKSLKKERILLSLISTTGFLAILYVAWPFFTWHFFTLPKFIDKKEVVPIPLEQVLSAKNVAYHAQVIKDEDGFSYFVPTNLQKSTLTNRPENYFLTVPDLEIENAIVSVDNLTFQKNLSHFPGTALPGEVGNSFITGHSVLPQFADPKNYKAIFTRLPELEIGDDVYININGNDLHFSVQYYKIVDPHDLSVLTPISESGKNITLMTCVPPGASTKRLVVIAGLI